MQCYDQWKKLLKNDIKLYDNVRKITTAQGDDSTTSCLLDYIYVIKHKMSAIDLNKQQTLDVDLKSIQQINFTRNLGGAGNRVMFFITKETKETILDY